MAYEIVVRRKIVKPLVFLESIKPLALQKWSVLFYKIFIIQERKRVGRKEREVCAYIVKIILFSVFSGI